MTTWQKWIVGTGIILAALGTYLAATFDNDDATRASLAATVDGVREGVNVIRGTTPATTPVAATVTATATDTDAGAESGAASGSIPQP